MTKDNITEIYICTTILDMNTIYESAYACEFWIPSIFAYVCRKQDLNLLCETIKEPRKMSSVTGLFKLKYKDFEDVPKALKKIIPCVVNQLKWIHKTFGVNLHIDKVKESIERCLATKESLYSTLTELISDPTPIEKNISGMTNNKFLRTKRLYSGHLLYKKHYVE